MKQKQDLSFWKLWNLSFGFFGVQIAYALQSANISRIFATLGADPHSLSYFWILPPLMGIVVQPIVGTLSDRTWCRFGRRIPYLFIGSAVAVAVMCLLPNAGSFGMAVSTAMVFGLISLMFLDTSINMAMQPFKMLVGDMVNEKQKSLAYSIQSFLCNSGSLIGYVFPFFFTAIGIANEAPKGVVPDSVIYSFYIGAAILILCVLYTTLTVKEWNPKEYAEYNERKPEAEEQKAGWVELLKNAPSMFWKVGLVQFFCWAAFMYMWTYTNGTIADTVWHTTDVSSAAYQEAGNWVGVLFFWQALGSVVWAMVLPRIKGEKLAYALSLAIGATGFAVLTLVLSLHAFPWDFVEGWFGPAVGKVVGMFQFPFRFLSLGTLLLCAAALFALQLLPERRAALAAAGLVCAALLTASITETNIMSAQGESSYATYNQNATINSVGTAEYLIDGASSYEAIWAQPKPASGDLHLISYEKREGVAYVSVENDGGEAAISLPIYNYGNYYAADESGAPFAIASGENMRIVLTIPAGYTGTIHVRYHAPGYWRAFEVLSAVSLLGVIGCGAFVRRKRRPPATV